MRARTTSVILLLLALVALPLTAQARTYHVDFGVTTGGPAPSGTITFADPEPANDPFVACTDFSFTDGTSTWTFSDDVLHGFFHGGFTSEGLTYIAVKVEDTVTGRYLQLYSSGNPGDYEICASVDEFDACSGATQTTGPFSFGLTDMPGLPVWGIVLLMVAMLGFAAFRIVTARRTGMA